MAKNETLEKSRRENQNEDEMERTIKIEGESFSLALTLLVGLVLVAYNLLHDLPTESVMIMFWTSCVGSRLYKLSRRKNTSDLVTLLISLAFLVSNMVKYFTQT